MNKRKIHILIDKYFDGETTLKEEKWLKENLPKMMGEDPEIDEFLAVAGYAVAPVRAGVSERRVKRSFHWVATAAASLALLIAAGGIYTYIASQRDSQSHFMAYSGGVQLDRQEAMQLIKFQMEEMSEASRDVQLLVEDDLADFRAVFD